MATILATCANGAGSSLLMKMAIDNVVQELGMYVTKVHHCSLAEGKSTAKNYDIIFCPLNFKSMFDDAAKSGIPVIGLKNVMSAAEIKKNIIELGLDVKFKK